MVKIPFPRARLLECKAKRHSECSGYQSPGQGVFGPTVQCSCPCHQKVAIGPSGPKLTVRFLPKGQLPSVGKKALKKLRRIKVRLS